MSARALYGSIATTHVQLHTARVRLVRKHFSLCKAHDLLGPIVVLAKYGLQIMAIAALGVCGALVFMLAVSASQTAFVVLLACCGLGFVADLALHLSTEIAATTKSDRRGHSGLDRNIATKLMRSTADLIKIALHPIRCMQHRRERERPALEARMREARDARNKATEEEERRRTKAAARERSQALQRRAVMLKEYETRRREDDERERRAALRQRALALKEYEARRLRDLRLREFDALLAMTSRQFEEFIAELFDRMGYSVVLTPGTRDAGKMSSRQRMGRRPLWSASDGRKDAWVAATS